MTKDELKQLKYLQGEKATLQAQIDKLRSLATSTAPAPSNVPSVGGERDKIGRCVAEIADMHKKVVIMEAKMLLYINEIADPLTKSIFQRHYIDGQPLKNIADALHYSYQHVYNVHNKVFKQ